MSAKRDPFIPDCCVGRSCTYCSEQSYTRVTSADGKRKTYYCKEHGRRWRQRMERKMPPGSLP